MGTRKNCKVLVNIRNYLSEKRKSKGFIALKLTVWELVAGIPYKVASNLLKKNYNMPGSFREIICNFVSRPNMKKIAKILALFFKLKSSVLYLDTFQKLCCAYYLQNENT